MEVSKANVNASSVSGGRRLLTRTTDTNEPGLDLRIHTQPLSRLLCPGILSTLT